MQLSPSSRHLIPLRSKYSPQHPVLIHLSLRLLVAPLKFISSSIEVSDVSPPTLTPRCFYLIELVFF
jgi:hypothetical protein